MVAKFCLFMDVLRKLAGVLRWCKLILIYAGWSFCVFVLAFVFGEDTERLYPPENPRLS
jgi:hypothetical protein